MMKKATPLAVLAVLVLGACAWAADAQPGRTIHPSTEFGWAANQDVTEAFTKLLTDGTLKAGDELVLDHTYRINIMAKSPRELPANFTLETGDGHLFRGKLGTATCLVDLVAQHRRLGRSHRGRRHVSGSR